ncbi:DUF3515 domain-containing protein [Herbiconiux moechotypicola]|uniref:DUF3515 domain-containing protein n=1 Tax=Herbiconiux moechotypicola TaxID=637393 RepID=A0ABN3DZA5_9MICO|nr:DUF3515 domain-containing protein [Herbiconiux moechotypicola]MCS5730889.1 DUF3515 domain-containing protein [Herbiconiux moechotypicola]
MSASHQPPHARSRRPLHRSRRRLGLAAAGLTLAAAATLLAGCSGPVALDPAADATNPSCADVIVRLPDTVADAERRETDAQATGAWGDPAAVLLVCGVEPPGPTTLPCDNVNGIDWIRDDSDAPTYTFTTFGRTPAVQVVVDSLAASGTSALVDLEPAVASIPQTSACLNADDVLGVPTPTPTPTPAETPASTPAP